MPEPRERKYLLELTKDELERVIKHVKFDVETKDDLVDWKDQTDHRLSHNVLEKLNQTLNP